MLFKASAKKDKITIISIGTCGDVQPLITLGRIADLGVNTEPIE